LGMLVVVVARHAGAQDAAPPPIDAPADTSSGPSNDAPPCLADIARLCGNVPPAGAYQQQCLEQQRARLSGRCRKHVGTLTRDRLTLRNACGGDLDRFCAGAPITAGGPTRCLLAHRDTLSKGCRDTIETQSKPD